MASTLRTALRKADAGVQLETRVDDAAEVQREMHNDTIRKLRRTRFWDPMGAKLRHPVR